LSAATSIETGELIERYLDLGLALGRHVDGFVDAYYGPPALADRVAAEPPRSLRRLAIDTRSLLGALDAGDGDLDLTRRRWLRAQVVGLRTSALKLAGEPIRYADEVESCYGVRPVHVDEDAFALAHSQLDEVLPGSGPLHDRYVAWRESQVVPVDVLPRAVESLTEDLRSRTRALFGLPDGESVEWELVSDKPWSGFNYYLGALRSRVAINTDLPVLSLSLAHLVAHETYPGHHTEHCRKEVGLVRQRRFLEESIFLVGTPQCLLAEGLADLGLEIVFGARPEPVVASHLQPLGVPYDADVAARVSEVSQALGFVRGNAGLLLHEDGVDVDVVTDYVARWGLLPRERAAKTVQFLTDPTWRSYMTCYVEGLPLCRRWVDGDPARFERLVTEQLTPADLQAVDITPG
jgi:hypothetical protein